ncbi:MAG: YraN family protein [Paludibacteraceae bacterium]|nr:YraN family protein [Paludibacteraceae bacterium]
MFVTDPIGIIGETEAARMLEAKGFKILEHNWRMGHLEVDLIAANKTEIVFAEVKARTSTFGNRMPEEYVDENKKRRMTAAANAYIKYHKIEKTPRFDIIGLIVHPQTGEITYRGHLENAFMPRLRTIHANSFSGVLGWHHRGHTIGRKKK